MKSNSIVALTQKLQEQQSQQATQERQAFSKNPTPGVKERKQFFNDTGPKRIKSFFQKVVEQEQKRKQRYMAQVEKVLKDAKWGEKPYSSESYTLFSSKSYPGYYIQVAGEEFSIYKNPKKAYFGFEGDVPMIGPMALSELENELKNFKG